ncbi:hypothetical protein HB780_22535 [Rhizobium lusitanum]|uniref:hypothetical protein n=1 Tax=Rhizobium lusitanum TaxID=293958 RepID=UPI00161548FC|nr:hypothetical protein [Rhizobium lusitanum]QND48391.1 hypothetical protein HB780_22535 [Rhizobium lusitanum]
MNKSGNDPTVTLRWMGQIAQHVAADRPLPCHLSLFLLQGLSPFLETAGEVSVDQAFGTRRHGSIVAEHNRISASLAEKQWRPAIRWHAISRSRPSGHRCS